MTGPRPLASELLQSWVEKEYFLISKIAKASISERLFDVMLTAQLCEVVKQLFKILICTILK